MKTENELAQFKKKPVVIAAIQFDGTPGGAVAVFEAFDIPGGKFVPDHDLRTGTLLIPTLEGDHKASVGDWIIRGIKGEFYPCKPDIFAETYEREIGAKSSAPHELAQGDVLAALKGSEKMAMPDEEIVADAMANHDKHYWALVQVLKRKRKGWGELADLIGEGSTVAKAIWNKYDNFDFYKTARSESLPQAPGALFVMVDCYKCPACKMPLSGTPEGHLPDCVVRKATETNLTNAGWISPYAQECEFCYDILPSHKSNCRLANASPSASVEVGRENMEGIVIPNVPAMVHKAERFEAKAKAWAEELHEIIFNPVNPDNDTIESIALSLKNFAESEIAWRNAGKTNECEFCFAILSSHKSNCRMAAKLKAKPCSACGKDPFENPICTAERWQSNE